MNWTSLTEARTVSVRSARISTSIACGIDARSWGNSFLMLSVTSMMLAPGWRWTLTMIARRSRAPGAAGARAADGGPCAALASLTPAQPASWAFSTPSITLATSDSRTGAPFLYAMISGRKLAALASWSLVASAQSWRGPSRLPLGWLTLAAAIASRTSSSVRPVPASATGSTWTRTAGFWPPPIVTRPTPATWEIFCASTESAKSSTSASGRVSDVTARVRIGWSAGLLFE